MVAYTKLPPNHEHSSLTQKPLITDGLDPLAPIALRSRKRARRPESVLSGPLEKVYLIWIVGGSCDGCTVAVSGATHPRVEDLLRGNIQAFRESTSFTPCCRWSQGQSG